MDRNSKQTNVCSKTQRKGDDFRFSNCFRICGSYIHMPLRVKLRDYRCYKYHEIEEWFVYVIGLHAVQFGNNWMRQILRTAKIGRGRRPSPICQSEEFFESNYFQIGHKHVVLLPIKYIASKNRWTWQIFDSLKYRKFSKYADEFGHYQHKTKPFERWSLTDVWKLQSNWSIFGSLIYLDIWLVDGRYPDC